MGRFQRGDLIYVNLGYKDNRTYEPFDSSIITLIWRTRKAIMETIRICKDRNVLKEYLESRENEVVNIMMTLFDEETIMKNYEAIHSSTTQ